MKTFHFTSINGLGIGVVLTGAFFIMLVIIGNSFNAYAACATLPNGLKTCETGLPSTPHAVLPSNETDNGTVIAHPGLHIPLYQSPLEQIREGISAQKVGCNTGLQLILKKEDGSPACVKPDTAQRLIERGWAKSITQLSFSCPPTDMGRISVNIPVKLPTKLPYNYSLQAIETTMNGDQVILYYADKQLCVPQKSFNYDNAQLRMVITKVGVEENSTEYQNNWLNHDANPETTTAATVQRIEVNGYKGVRIEPYTSSGGAVFFLNDNDQTTYSLFALNHQSLEQLLDIAKSIPS